MIDKIKHENYLIELCKNKKLDSLKRSNCILLRWAVSEKMYNLAFYLIKKGCKLSANKYESLYFIIKNNDFDFIVKLIEENHCPVDYNLCHAIMCKSLKLNRIDFLKRFSDYVYQHSGFKAFTFYGESINFDGTIFETIYGRTIAGELMEIQLPIEMHKQKLFELDES